MITRVGERTEVDDGTEPAMPLPFQPQCDRSEPIAGLQSPRSFDDGRIDQLDAKRADRQGQWRPLMQAGTQDQIGHHLVADPPGQLGCLPPALDRVDERDQQRSGMGPQGLELGRRSGGPPGWLVGSVVGVQGEGGHARLRRWRAMPPHRTGAWVGDGTEREWVERLGEAHLEGGGGESGHGAQPASDPPQPAVSGVWIG